jgi:hypothetical protein
MEKRDLQQWADNIATALLGWCTTYEGSSMRLTVIAYSAVW